MEAHVNINGDRISMKVSCHTEKRQFLMAIHGTRHEILFLAIFTWISVPKLRELITWAMSGLSGCETKKTKI